MPQIKEYLRPESRAEALEILGRPGFTAVPGLIQPKPASLRTLEGDAFLDLDLLGLDQVSRSEDGWITIGATTTLQSIGESDLLGDATDGLLAAACGCMATPGIRNLASLGGALQDPGGPPELLLALLALDTRVSIWQTATTQREMSLQEFIEQGGAAVRKGELAAGARFQAPDFSRSAWSLERLARTPRDEAVLAVAALVEFSGGKIEQAALAVAGANELPLRYPSAEKSLRGFTLAEEKIDEAARIVMRDCHPAGDYRGSQEYRRAMAGALVSRALGKIRSQVPPAA